MSNQRRRRRRESPASDLRAVAAHAVRMYLEVACGRRPPRTMTGLATPLAAAQLQEAAGRARDDQRPGRIHRIALHRPTHDSAEITALIRDNDGHVSAVTMQLQQVGRRWQLADIAHLDRGHHHTHTQTVADYRPPKKQLAERRFDVAVLNGAAAAADQRARSADAPEHGAGDARVAARLRQRAQRLAAALPDTPQPSTRAPAMPSPSEPTAKDGRAYQVALLGPRPGEGQTRGLWNAAAKLVDGYRLRWNVTDPVNALGAVPSRGTQRDDRKRTLTRVSGLVRDMNSLQRQLDRQPLAKRIEPGLDGP